MNPVTPTEHDPAEPIAPTPARTAPTVKTLTGQREFDEGRLLAEKGLPLPDNATAAGKEGWDTVAKAARGRSPEPSDRRKPGSRSDGPTLEQWLAQGGKAADYPPEGYEAKRKDPEQLERVPVNAVKELSTAREALGAIIRSCLNNKIHIHDPGAHGRLENAFEEAKNSVGGNKAERGHLQNAAAALELGVDLLSNYTLKDPSDLTNARAAAAHARKLADFQVLPQETDKDRNPVLRNVPETRNPVYPSTPVVPDPLVKHPPTPTDFGPRPAGSVMPRTHG